MSVPSFPNIGGFSSYSPVIGSNLIIQQAEDRLWLISTCWRLPYVPDSPGHVLFGQISACSWEEWTLCMYHSGQTGPSHPNLYCTELCLRHQQPFVGWMNKQTMAQPDSWIPLHNNGNDSQKHYAKWTKPDSKWLNLYDSVYVTFQKRQTSRDGEHSRGARCLVGRWGAVAPAWEKF